jgi:hypothetical protein
LDEFPREHEPGPEPESWRGLIVAIVAVGVVVSLAALYFYGFSRGPASDDALVMAPAPGDTEVAVEPAPTVASPDETAPRAVSDADEGPTEVARPLEVVPAEVEPVAPAGTGTITVRSTPPGALVTVDGERAGLTPVTVPDLSYGAHDVLVARPGYVPSRERVELTAASVSRTLTISLSAGAGADVSSAGPAVGSLDVDSRPRGATVHVDGRRAGVTPLRMGSLPSGAHVVELSLSGYRVVRTEVTVEGGRPSRLAVTLEPGGS